MLKQDVFFMVLYGSFFAVMLTFIISFDGTNGFGKKNHIQTFIEGQFKNNNVGGKVPKFRGGKGDTESVKKPDVENSQLNLLNISQYEFDRK